MLVTKAFRYRFSDHADIAACPARFEAFVHGLFNAVEGGDILRVDPFYRLAGGMMKQLGISVGQIVDRITGRIAVGGTGFYLTSFSGKKRHLSSQRAHDEKKSRPV